MEVNNNKNFVIKESKIFKTRKLYTVDSKYLDFIMSELTENVVCATSYNHTIKTNFSDYFTKDGKMIRGSLDVEYNIIDPISYSYEPLTNEILDVFVRTVLSSYFSHFTLDELVEQYKDKDAVSDKILNVINHFVRKYIPFINLEDVADIYISKSELVEDDKFCVIDDNTKFIGRTNADNSGFMKPIVHFFEENIASKRYYPKKVYVAQNEMLYYGGDIKKPGMYHGKNARGNIIAGGKHVYSPNAEIFISKDEELYKVYPNFLYNVIDLEKYLENYDYIRNRLNILSSLIIQYEYKNNDYIINIDDIYNNSNEHIYKLIEDIESYGIKLEYITYSTKNPHVKEQVRERTAEGFEVITLNK